MCVYEIQSHEASEIQCFKHLCYRMLFSSTYLSEFPTYKFAVKFILIGGEGIMDGFKSKQNGCRFKK